MYYKFLVYCCCIYLTIRSAISKIQLVVVYYQCCVLIG